MKPTELLHFAGTHDYSKANETMRVIMDAATEIERLQTALTHLIAATELHHRNPMDLENLERYNQAKLHAKQAICTGDA